MVVSGTCIIKRNGSKIFVDCRQIHGNFFFLVFRSVKRRSVMTLWVFRWQSAARGRHLGSSGVSMIPIVHHTVLTTIIGLRVCFAIVCVTGKKGNVRNSTFSVRKKNLTRIVNRKCYNHHKRKVLFQWSHSWYKNKSWLNRGRY